MGASTAAPIGEFRCLWAFLPHGPDVFGDPTGPYRVVRSSTAMWSRKAGHRQIKTNRTTTLSLRSMKAPSRVISNDFWNPFDFVVSGDISTRSMPHGTQSNVSM